MRASRSNSSGEGSKTRDTRKCSIIAETILSPRSVPIASFSATEKRGRASGAPGKPDIQAGLQICEMLPSSLSTARIIAKIFRTSVNLPGNETQHVFRRFLVDTHDPARMAKVCELNRKAEPIGGAPTLAD